MKIVLDTETTGTDPRADRIVEVALLVSGDVRVRRLNPQCPIPPEATKVHGITDADVKDCPTFAQVGASLRSLLASATEIVAFNARFDLEILQAELERTGLPPLDLTAVRLVDPLRLWQRMEPRTLEAAVQRFAPSHAHQAHSARGDVLATAAVLDGMRALWPDGDADPLPERATWIGPSSHIRRDGDRVVLGFGKWEGALLSVVPRDYLQWIVRDSFPLHVKEIARAALDYKTFDAWLAERYPLKGAA